MLRLPLIPILASVIALAACSGGSSGGNDDDADSVTDDDDTANDDDSADDDDTDPGVRIETREQAIEHVLNVVLPSLEFDDPERVLVYATETAVSAGTPVREGMASVDEDGEHRVEPRLLFNLPADGWVFWLDPVPQERFAHETVVAAVTAKTMIVEESDWWPRIDGQNWLATTQERTGATERVWPQVDFFASEGVVQNREDVVEPFPGGAARQLGQPLHNADDPCVRARGAWLIQGGADDDFQTDIEAMRAHLLNQEQVDDGFVLQTVGADTGNPLQLIEDWELLVQSLLTRLDLYEHVCFDRFYIYYSGHGDKLGGMALGPDEDSDTVIPYSAFFRLLEPLCADAFVIVNDSCYAGRMIASAKNRQPGLNGTAYILTSSDAQTTSLSLGFAIYTDALLAGWRVLNAGYSDAELPLRDRLWSAHVGAGFATYKQGIGPLGNLYKVGARHPQMARVTWPPRECPATDECAVGLDLPTCTEDGKQVLCIVDRDGCMVWSEPRTCCGGGHCACELGNCGCGL